MLPVNDYYQVAAMGEGKAMNNYGKKIDKGTHGQTLGNDRQWF